MREKIVKQPPVEDESYCSVLIFLKKSKDLRFIWKDPHTYIDLNEYIIVEKLE